MAKAANTSNKQIETLADLTPDPRNARKHNPRNVGMLEKSLNEVGAARSIVIDENGVVLAGNATIEAAGRAGIERVQVVDADGETIVAVRRTGLTQTQKTRLALYDNRTAELADWDADLIADLMANERAMLDGLFDNNELLELIENIEQTGSADAEPQIDRAAELNEKWQVKPQDLWRIGNHRLLCGDCTVREDVQRVMGGERAHFIITSPPYGVGMEYEGKPDEAVTIDLIKRCFGNICDFVEHARFAFVNFGERYIWAKPMAQIYHETFKNLGWRWYDQRFWKRANVGMAIWNTTQPRAMSQVEYLFTFQNGNKIYPVHNLDISKEQLWNDVGSSLEKNHPAVMALGVADKAITIYTEIGECVIEPFAGSGTTLVASENLQRKCFGIEISPNYCAVILERMQTAFPALVIERIT